MGENVFGFPGFPNVGKSSLINILKGSPVCLTGVNKGITKSVTLLNFLWAC